MPDDILYSRVAIRRESLIALRENFIMRSIKGC
jgi:hypothetical protein